MKAVRVSAFGVPHRVATCAEVADPGAPAADEVVVEVEAFPINPADLMTLEGRFFVRPSLPATPGLEGVGVIAAAGSDVVDLAVGDRVILLCRENWAQKRRAQADQVLKVRSDADVLQLAMLRANPATARLMLRDYVKLDPGDWVIQDAANSGVGKNLIRLARAEGIHTVNVVRRESLIGELRAIGADVVLTDGDDLAERVKAATGGAHIRLAIDAVAGDICMRLANCLAEGGVLVNYGEMSGKPCMVTHDQIVTRNLTLTGFLLGRFLTRAPRVRVQALYDDLAGRIADGRLFVDVEATYPIEDIAQALAHAEREARDGKILVTPNGPV